MGWSPEQKERRRAALIKLQQLLSQADESLSVGHAESDRVFKDLGTAFEDFRTKYQDRSEPPTPATPATDGRWIAVRQLASAIVEMDDSVTRRDQLRVRAALNSAKDALEALQRIDAAGSSGLRVRLPENVEELALAKRRREK